jgi:hypothetical protein
VDRIQLAQDRVEWWAVVNMVSNKPLNSMKAKEFIYQLSHLQLLKDSSLWIELVFVIFI